MMEKYDEKAINKKCRGLWEAEGVYKFDASKSRAETFALDTPPPTVSGSLHMGHVLGYTQADILARFRRMKGGTVFFPIGWDDNGLPTERRVQNYFNIKCDPKIPYDPNFAAEHRDKFDEPQRPVSRKNFIEHCRRLIGADEKVFEDILRQMGMSYDWSLMYSTISDEAIRLAQESFIKLYGAGHVKSVDAPTMWDTGFQTAVAIAEIEDREVDGFFHDIKFGSDAGDFVISTTRPEFLPACVAVVAHPDDSRYRHLIGKTAATPLFGAKVPIFGDPHADPEKGTGIMMVCTFGDSEDVKFWKEHGLPLKQIIGRDGKIIDTEWIARKELVGLPVKAARRQIVEWLRESGDLAAEPRPIRHSVKFYEKGDTPIEFVPSRQWFVSTVGKKQALLDAADKISWTPEYMKSRFVNWTENLNQDWAISRQRFFGVPFPVWYGLDESGEPDFDHPIIAKKLPCDPATECPDGFAPDQRGRANGFVGDPDVMDTWMTSALTPKIAMAMTDAKNLDMPFDARWNGHEIIRTWDFCTILTALLNDERLPWRGLWINGFVLDKDRKKMSKSKGNVVVPHDLVEKFGSDAIRLWAASSKWGTDASADEKVMEQKRKLVVKFFNAAKFIFPFKDKGGEISNPLDAQWRSRLGAAARESGKCFASNDHAGALAATEQCFWDFCDNYLETAKGRAYGGDASAVRALHFSLDAFCKMFAPFMPFITEEAWRETHSAS
ncbi:MAG: valine--tRNA ligase, partial [Rickettsiales bacterium]|nr:valine--tRNA ligase [Rickettsiales bacterium]